MSNAAVRWPPSVVRVCADRYFPALAALKLAGGAGILIGLWLEPLGVAAAAGLVAYSPCARVKRSVGRVRDLECQVTVDPGAHCDSAVIVTAGSEGVGEQLAEHNEHFLADAGRRSGVGEPSGECVSCVSDDGVVGLVGGEELARV